MCAIKLRIKGDVPISWSTSGNASSQFVIEIVYSSTAENTQ